MKSKLFWRLFWAFLATLMVTVLVMSALMVVMVRSERQESLETEVKLQARDLAFLFQSYTSVPKRQSWTLQTTLGWKMAEIKDNYDAEMWLVSATGDAAYSMLVGSGEDPLVPQEYLDDPKVLAQIGLVCSGEEITVQGLIAELGPNIVTIGVPWMDRFGNVYGAVLLHISTENLTVDYLDIIRFALVASLSSLLIGTAMAYWISKRQTTPLREINRAVTRFAAGELDDRVQVKGSDELAQLGESFNKMARDLSNLEKSRREFVASVSHELRSPLTCIQGYVQGMMDGTIPLEEHPKYMGVVDKESRRLTKLVNELLDLSRIESGAFSLALSAFDVNELIRLELIKFEQRINDKKLDVDVIFKEPQCMVSADADRIRQVMTNLIDNAVKYAPEGALITVDTHSVQDKCYVSVKNTGEAIPAEDLPFIFDRFYKADKAHTSGMGTGLGLSIARHIVEQHGHQIKAISNASGTTFLFSLDKSP